MQILDSLVAGAVQLPDERERDEYLSALTLYLWNGTEPTSLTGAAQALWTATFPVISNSRKKAVNRRGKRKQNTSDNKTDIKTDNKPDKDIYSSSYSSSKQTHDEFSELEPPTKEEVRAYFEANMLNGDPEDFWLTYESQGWVKGNGQQVVNWQAQALKWSRDQRSRDAAKPPEQQHRPMPKPVNAPDTTLEDDIAEFRRKYGRSPD